MNFKMPMTLFLLILNFPVCVVSGEQPNIIFIMADDLGYNDLSCMGQKHFSTPNIDRLAKGGMKFTQFYSGSTVCAPSRACFLTGMHTGHVYQRFNGKVQFRENPLDKTVAHRLRQMGYKTAMIGKSGLSCNSNDKGLPNRKGFDHFFGFVAHAAAHRYYPKTMIRNGLEINYASNQGKEGDEYSGDLFLKEAIDWISANKDSRFFLHLSLQQPHADLQVPNDYRQKFIGKFVEKPYAGGHYRAEAHPKSTFAGMVSYLDDSVGKILNRVNELNLDENTLFVFTSDNGPHFEGGYHADYFDSNGPLRGGKRDLYEGGFAYPLLFSGRELFQRVRLLILLVHFGIFLPRHVSWRVLPIRLSPMVFRLCRRYLAREFKTNTTIFIGNFMNKVVSRRFDAVIGKPFV